MSYSFISKNTRKYAERMQRKAVKNVYIAREYLVLAETNLLSLDPNMHACYAACIYYRGAYQRR